MSLCLLFRLPIAGALFIIVLCGDFAARLRAQPPSVAPTTLDFDNVVAPGNPDITGLEIDPWAIGAQKFHTVSLPDAGLLRFANNGTPFIASVGGGLDYPITIERLDGSPFSLVSFDAAEGFLDDLLAAEQGFASATKIEVEAALTSGFTVTLGFDLDGLRDGVGGVDDFESFHMSDGLQNVTSITFTGLSGNRRDAGFALDNVVVAAVVPEPATSTLIIAGIILVSVTVAARHRSEKLKGAIASRRSMPRINETDFLNTIEVASYVGNHEATVR
jgi:hypothetical protein